ncbi:PLP-dependent aminotransferase family protein [Vreelandella salicampi]|uniref:PLP-dependent aminotransferase family protein n=1 Tax=Vreelandella salicampi TaxID=1449798 RepID=A0A7Z0LKA3_9GAMM|nr:PLP-dependent aminotransferase family protein [Halomonas salicampi]NYS60537.1 PLP-dependent aminotransferase family protein [Halomonas salicampi]
MTIWVPNLEAYSGSRYRAIAAAIGDAINAATLQPGEKLPPQRHLADALGVTIGTVTRGYAEAERHGWVTAKVGSGTYVMGRHEATTFQMPHVETENDDAHIDLSLSLPPPHPLRQQGLASALAVVGQSQEALNRGVSYQPAQGSTAQRQVFSEWLATLGFDLSADELLLTQGGQHGVQLSLQGLLRPGELVAADALTYPGLMSAARQSHLKLVGIPFDDDGMSVEALKAQCERQPPRLLYLTPDQNNPTGVTLSLERREAIVALAREYDVWLLEDAVQYLPASERLTPLYHLAPERTLFVFSTAKVLAGGLRIGVLRTPQALLERLTQALRAQNWMVPPLLVDVACHWVTQASAREVLAWQNEELKARQALAADVLTGFTLQARKGGSNLWLMLPEGFRAVAFSEQLKSHGVLVTSAEPFCVGNAVAPQAIRLCLGAARDRDTLRRALLTLRDCLQAGPIVSPTL